MRCVVCGVWYVVCSVCCVILCYDMLCYVILCSVMLCYDMLYVMLCYVMLSIIYHSQLLLLVVTYIVLIFYCIYN